MKMRLLMVGLLLFLAGRGVAQRNHELKPGDKAPDFRCKDMEGRIHTMKEFEGKYVLLDFWASYCGPCQEEIPFLKAVEEKFRKKKITFVSISTDMEKEEWVKKVQEKELKGMQLIIDRADIGFIHQYRVETIPRYILIDKEGKIMNLNLPRPSELEMMKILKKLKGI